MRLIDKQIKNLGFFSVFHKKKKKHATTTYVVHEPVLVNDRIIIIAQITSCPHFM